MNPLHEQFIAEARELVHQAADDLVALEREGLARERIDRVFRAFHTLKGSAGIVELPVMGMMLHAAEDVLAAIQAGQIFVEADVIDQALACLDQVSVWVDAFEVHAALPADSAERAQTMARRLRAFLPSPAPNPQAGPVSSGEKHAFPTWVSDLIASRRDQISQALSRPSTALCAISYEPRVDCFFNGDDPVGLMRQVPVLLALRVEPRDAWARLAELDPYACNLRLRAIAAGERVELAAIFRFVADQVSIIDIPAEVLRSGPALTTEANDVSGLICSIIEEQQRVIAASVPAQGFAGRVGAAARSAANALRFGGRDDLAQEIDGAKATALAQGDAAVLSSALKTVLASLKGIPSGEAPAAGPIASQVGDAARPALRLLRVDEARIDTLVNLAGELVVAKNGLAHLARRVEDELRGQELAVAVRHQHETIERLASGIHAAVLQLRMVPVGQVLQPFPRLVREMSQRLHKKVELVTRGETAQADKTIVDRLFEPLLHLVRNALDHGIEAPEQRRSAGKDTVASITIQASRIGDRFLVEVIDDGRGIDPAAVRGKLQERQFRTEAELAALSDEQAIDLIFLSGFSTAGEVSDISGRGIGMDAVRTAVEQIGGRVSITSVLGAGTTVKLDLPTNIALSRIMVVESAGELFGVPMDAVTETVRLTADRISQIKNNKGFVWRDRVVPICPLAELMRLPDPMRAVTETKLLIVIDAGGAKMVALEVDAIHDRLDVVLKPLQGLLAGAAGFTGTTLMGDGRILLVLDLKEVLS